MTAEYKVEDGIAVISMNNPPVNGLGYATRLAVAEGLDRANADAGVKAVVLTGLGRAFSGGADIREFNSPLATREPTLGSLIRLVELSAKPVVAAIHSVAMGGGLELALGCHLRVAAPGAQIALPEVKLGLLPGAGGTQRLPRVLGVENALNMVVSGEPVKSEMLAMAPGQKLFDKLSASAETLMADAKALAAKAAADHAAGAPLPLVRNLPCSHPQADAYFEFARNTARAVAPNYPAPVKCVNAVEAATKGDFETGLKTERELFLSLIMTPESAALRHVFFAQRAATKIPDVGKDVKPRKVERVAVVGAGTMGGGIAMNFLNAGIPVTLLEVKQEALDHGVGVMRKNYEARMKKGKLQPEEFQKRMTLLQTTLDYADLKDADLVVEAVFESMDVKQAVFRQLDQVMKPGAILATNTSTLDINHIAEVTQRPQDVVGTHFFSPANVMKLLEVVRTDKTAPDVLASIMQVAKRIKKTAVVARVCDGFIGNRMIGEYSRQAGFLLDEGASPEQIDRAIEKFGFAMGPFRMSDLAGNDISWAIRKRRYAENPDFRFSKAADLLCEMGRFGQKTGAGWYDYPAGSRKPVSSPVVAEMIDQHRKTQGITPRKITNDEIVQRLVYALVNEGARILEDGIASKASDIDVVYLMGYGFPIWRGGPMQYADQVGLFNVAAAMKRFALNPLDDARCWQPAALITTLAAEGKTFN